MSDLQPSTFWWIVTGLLVAVELATGTVYLLMLSTGAAAAALAAHSGASVPTQIVLAAVVGVGASVGWKLYRRRRGAAPAPASQNRDVNLDIGESVTVDGWNDDGSATVSYRGAAWQARWLGDGAPRPGPHMISAIEGNRLLLVR